MQKFNKHDFQRRRVGKWLFLSPISLVWIAAASQAENAAVVLEPIVVSADHTPLDPDIPASTYSVTRKSLEVQSFINTEDALAYAPNTVVRKRFVGDRNANLGGRSFGTTQPARGLVYVDGYLISNFLGRFDAPRWSMVAPEEVERVDVLYGPFSAIYPGNSIGTTVEITTRTPEKEEASADIQVQRQRHDDYGLRRDTESHQQSAYLANRWDRVSLGIALNRLSYESHPMGYATASPVSNDVTGLPMAEGAAFDTDPSGSSRVIVGATGMQKGIQEQAKIKLGYALTPTLHADLLYARWRNDYRVRNRTLLRDAVTGEELWNTGSMTTVNIDGTGYRLPNMVPQEGREDHQQLGARLRTQHKFGWNHALQVSSYRVLDDASRQAAVSDPLAVHIQPGTNTIGDGTGWNTLELRSTYTPRADEAHALTFGLHRNRYRLNNRVFNLENWHDAATRTTESANYFGKTEVTAVYAQDAWRFLPDWTATFGLRLERFRAWDGSQFNSAATSGAQMDYEDRRDSATSPKFSLAHVLNDEWMMRASVGRGVRFPTVSELFQGARSGTSIIRNDPNMQPEINDAKELSFIRETQDASLRLSLFEDDIRDAIFQQQQTVGAVTVTTVQNVDRVRTRGIEAALQARDVWLDGLDWQASIAFTRAKILRNPAVPDSEGKNWPRVPRVRASILGSYRTGRWTGSLGLRHEGRQYGTLDNSDIHDDTVGAVSSFTVANAKLVYQAGETGRFSVGVDNLTDKRYYVGPHPYPGRTFYAEAHFSY